MKHLFVKNMALTIFMALAGCAGKDDPAKWSSSETDKWFEKGEWLNGWNVTPDASVNRKSLALSWYNNPERWNAAFRFLKENDLAELAPGRYDIDGDNLYVSVSEYLTKNEEDASYEAHRKYIDIQYVVSGVELIGIAPVSLKQEVREAYDPERDIEFFSVNRIENHEASPDRFFIFFPEDAHRPGLKKGDNSMVRKIVVKLITD